MTWNTFIQRGGRVGNSGASHWIKESLGWALFFRPVPERYCQGTANIGYVARRQLFVLNPLLEIINKTSRVLPASLASSFVRIES